MTNDEAAPANGLDAAIDRIRKYPWRIGRSGRISTTLLEETHEHVEKTVCPIPMLNRRPRLRKPTTRRGPQHTHPARRLPPPGRPDGGRPPALPCRPTRRWSCMPGAAPDSQRTRRCANRQPCARRPTNRNVTSPSSAASRRSASTPAVRAGSAGAMPSNLRQPPQGFLPAPARTRWRQVRCLSAWAEPSGACFLREARPPQDLMTGCDERRNPHPSSRWPHRFGQRYRRITSSGADAKPRSATCSASCPRASNRRARAGGSWASTRKRNYALRSTGWSCWRAANSRTATMSSGSR